MTMMKKRKKKTLEEQEMYNKIKMNFKYHPEKIWLPKKTLCLEEKMMKNNSNQPETKKIN
jgi:hypothetical protein